VGLPRGRYPAVLRPNLKVHLHRFLTMISDPVTLVHGEPRARPEQSVTSPQRKAAEDSRTPGRGRVFSHAIQSARFWSAAVLCRFQVTRPKLHDKARVTRPVKRLIIPLAILLLILIGYNVLIHHTAKSTFRHHLLTSLSEIPLDTDFLFLGNSLVETGCNPSAFRAAWPVTKSAPRPVNIALGATSPVEHYLILKHALDRPLRPRFLVYGFFDDQLNAPSRGDWADLVGNRAFSYYFPDEAAALYAPGSSIKKWQLRIIGHIPMLAERSSFWGKVELLRRDIEDIGMPKQQTTRYGRVKDFAALEAADLPSFNQRCDTILSQRPGFSPAIRKIIELAQQHGITLILLEMPMPSRHRNIFYSSPAWSETRAYLQTLAQQNQAVYICASDWIIDDQAFEDATHLNEEGAKQFSAKLAETLSQASYQHRAVGTLP